MPEKDLAGIDEIKSILGWFITGGIYKMATLIELSRIKDLRNRIDNLRGYL
ncbi:MAG: hypothetical protein GX556_18800 [Fibrobacter sp.]|nr:hypothetical protein [Fibrobacter sp.]